MALVYAWQTVVPQSFSDNCDNRVTKKQKGMGRGGSNKILKKLGIQK